MGNFEVIQKATGASYYFRLVRIADNYIWNDTLKVWAETVAWSDSMITITESNASGDYPLPIPTGFTGTGDANITVYTNVSADNTDVIAYGREMSFGSIFGF